MQRITIMICAALVAFASVDAYAEEDAAPEQAAPAPTRWDALKEQFDLDKDGRITWEEYRKVTSGFTALDQDGDGVITKADAEKLPAEPSLAALQPLLGARGGAPGPHAHLQQTMPFAHMPFLAGMRQQAMPFGGLPFGGHMPFGGGHAFPGAMPYGVSPFCGASPFGGQPFMGGMPQVAGTPYGALPFGRGQAPCGSPFGCGVPQGGWPTAGSHANLPNRFLRTPEAGGAMTPGAFPAGRMPTIDGKQARIMGAMLIGRLADTNRDGTIDAAEWTTWRKSLEHDDEGKVADTAFADVFPPQAGTMGKQLLAAVLDHDKDGVIEISDLEAIYKAVDEDGDGAIILKDLAPTSPFGLAPAGR